MRYWIFFLLFISLEGFSQKGIEQSIHQLIKKQPGFNGVVLVAENGKPLYYRAVGFRNFETKTLLKKSDIFELASVSKQFTAMIIMMLKEKGKLDYDDPVEKYLSLPYRNITIRHLLTHTSGLPDYQEIMDKHWDKSKVASNKEILEYLNQYAPAKLFEPGDKYEYSNTGYVLMASIAEKASGEDFIELCRKWIFLPLDMVDTDIRTLADKAALKNLAVGHIYVEERKMFIRADSFPSSNYTIWLGNRKGPGRIGSTAADLLKWDQALYTEKLVKKTTLAEAFQTMKLNDGTYSKYGFGWELPKEGVVMHTGDNPGYATRIVRYINKNRTIIILSNNAFKKQPELVEEMEKLFN